MNRLIASLIGLGLVFLIATLARAESAEWKLDPTSGDWNTPDNWTPMSVPNGPTDTATFALSNTTSVSLSANTEVDGITFTAAATNSYTITASPTFTLTLSGTGITNNSGATQNFVTGVDGAGDAGRILFTNGATAGTSTVFTNNGGAVAGAFGGNTVFVDSTAGSGTFTNNGSAVAGANGGFAQFFENSSAGSGTFSNNGGAVAGANGGVTFFRDTSTAGSGTFTNNGGAVAGASGGFAEFFENSSAGSGTFTNNGSTVAGAHGGATEFLDNSTAGSGIFTNNGGAGVGGGSIGFSDTSTAGNGTFTNNGSAVAGASGGSAHFVENSSAGSGTFTNNGGAVDGANGGVTFFNGTSTAGSGTFTNNGGAVAGADGGSTVFSDTSSAGSGTFINNGSAVAGADGGVTVITGGSTADSATLIANGGTSGGQGGQILFEGNSFGGTSRVEVFGNGTLDVGFHNDTLPAIGSIEGDGNVFLGGIDLAVGSNNMDTTFSGVIQDGGRSPDFGGTLFKIGTGTLDLTGTINIRHLGSTRINGGVLKVDGSITASRTFVNADGTLAGTGTVHGNVVNTGGTVSPGNAPGPGTLTVTGTYTQQAFATLMINIAGESAGQFSVLNVLGNADLNGTLEPVLLNGFIPAIGDSFVFLIYENISGAFSSIENPVFNNGTERWEVTYQSTDAILTATKNVPDQGSTLLLLTLGLLGLVTYQQSLRRKQA